MYQAGSHYIYWVTQSGFTSILERIILLSQASFDPCLFHDLPKIWNEQGTWIKTWCSIQYMGSLKSPGLSLSTLGLRVCSWPAREAYQIVYKALEWSDNQSLQIIGAAPGLDSTSASPPIKLPPKVIQHRSKQHQSDRRCRLGFLWPVSSWSPLSSSLSPLTQLMGRKKRMLGKGEKISL